MLRSYLSRRVEFTSMHVPPLTCTLFFREIFLILNFMVPCIAGRWHSGGRGLASLVAICLMTVSSGPLVAAEKGQSAYKEGRDQEARQNYEAAYEAYLRACEKETADIQCRAAIARTRYLAAASKVHRATLLRELGKLEESLELFKAAAAIDPSSAIAVQEVATTRSMIRNAKTHPRPEQPRPGTELSPDILDAQGPVKLAPVSNVPITLKLSEDTKMVYETVGKLASLNVLFDPDYTSRRVNIELNGVTLQEALDIVAAESKTFWHPLTPNTIFVATDNPAKRKDLEQNVVKTFYLANLTAPTELQDIVNTLRTVLDVTRVQQLPSQEAIVIRGTPDQVLLAEKMVNDFDTAAPEVVIDVAVMQVSRDKVHNLGITPPTSASVQLKPNTTTSSSSSTDNTINLNSLANLNATDFTATISAMSFNALASDSATKIIQNPQLRSLNGQKATLKVGDRVPIATGSTQSGLSGTAVTGLTNTQFQYIDVGVNLDVTPHIHSDGEVTLKVVLEVSSVSSYVTIGGISEPVIGQRKVEHEIRLKDGEANLLGGMLEQQDVKSISGIPGFSQIPILKYFFAEKNTELKDNEIVFVLVPHIVRRREFSELSRRTLDVGNANSIRLRHAPKATPDGDANASDEPAPAAKRPGEATAALELDPLAVSTTKGATFAINVVLSGAQNALSVPLQLSYDNVGLQIVNVSNGDFLSQGQQVVALVRRDDPSFGLVEINASRPSGSGGVSGHGVITTLTFQAKESGRFPVKITKGAVVQADQQIAPVSGSEITVSVQ
jgi:general secretion pathway protein D